VSDVLTYLDVLSTQACPEGGWGYAPGQSAHLEPTCLSLLALSHDRDRFSKVIEAGRKWLAQCVTPEGLYVLERGRPEAVWPTAMVLFTQATLGEPPADLTATTTALLGLRGRDVSKDDDDINDVNSSLIGWPWAANNFSWVEPTSWACLALKRVGQAENGRVQDGEKMLLDRALEEGGINYGNRRILGIALEPIPGPTALMLLALQGHPEHPRITSAVAYLQREKALTGDDLEHLCWARLALDAYRDQAGVTDTQVRLGERIRSAHEARAAVPWLRPAPLRLALTALALAVEQRNPFRLTPPSTAKQLPPKVLKPIQPGWGERLKWYFKGKAIDAVGQLRGVGPTTNVHIAPASDYNADLADVVRRQYEHFRAQVPLKGKRVVLKPNLVEYHRDKVINTNPNVVAAVIELCRREEAAEILVAEGPGHWRNVEYLVSASGLGDVLHHYKVPFRDLNHDEPIKTVNLGRLTRLNHLYLARTIASADVVISLPKLKTHHWAVATLSLKNLFGTLPGICYGWPKNELHWRGIDNSIVDIALTRTPDLAIVDGIIGMEGDGPLNGTAKPMGVLMMGNDLLAVDATCCRLMGLDPSKVGYLVLGERKKLGILAAEQVQQLGETIAGRAQPFDTVPHFKQLRLGQPA
jgi:uncharacterized protein (DUF362 family)